MSAQWDSFEIVPADLASQSLAIKARRRILKSNLYRKPAQCGLRLPLQFRLDDLCCDNFVEYTAEQCRKQTIDAVLVEYVYLSRVLEAVPGNIIKVLDTHDVFADRHQRLIRGGVQPSFFTTTPAEETRGLSRADVVIAIQEHEREYFARNLNGSAEVITVSHTEPHRFLPTRVGPVKTVGLLGSDNDINLASVRQFCEDVRGRGALSTIKILVGGTVCARLVDVPENVELLGIVESLEDFYKSIDMFINPMITGTGLKIKTVESLSYGIPLLSTATGTEGIDVEQKFHHFPRISDLLDHLCDLVVCGTSLEPYADASRSCFNRYTHKVHSQMSDLAERFAKLDSASCISPIV